MSSKASTVACGTASGKKRRVDRREEKYAAICSCVGMPLLPDAAPGNVPPSIEIAFVGQIASQ
jgi:hypothetical protein